MDKLKVYIVEDDPLYGKIIQYNLSLNPDIEAKLFSNANDFLNKLEENPDLITLDYSLPDMTGEEVLKRIKKYNPNIPVVIVSGQENLKTAIKLLKDGAYDYLTKDEETKDRIWNIIKNIRENLDLKEEISNLKDQISKQFDLSKTVIGISPVMKKVYSLVEKAVNSSITVSLTGETGVGKEVIAKAIHYNSKLKNKPFVSVNITAIPKDLIESELFGHEKGSFTGAIARRVGKFEEADGGTLFLDEIGEMDINMQSKLLRVLQEKEITRVGGNGIIKITCRIIAATHRDLAEEVRKGNFREDLYYRLLGLPIPIPPLRMRGNDILLLAKHFINEYCKENDVNKISITPETNQKLLKYEWPGNVRELKAVIELACVMCENNSIVPDDIQFSKNYSIDSLLAKEMPLRDYSNNIIKHYLLKYNDDVILVSKKLKIGKSTIYRMLQKKTI
ncbi:MAG: sigma-54-dependent Fis family transcriptional regulator [Bacteroidia bacterium]|nr:sigma-54-dependent Fis family transcriptional regulator [Bacteroidia bacterium]